MNSKFNLQVFVFKRAKMLPVLSFNCLSLYKIVAFNLQRGETAKGEYKNVNLNLNFS